MMILNMSLRWVDYLYGLVSVCTIPCDQLHDVLQCLLILLSLFLFFKMQLRKREV